MSDEHPDWRTALTEDRNRGTRSFWVALFLSVFLGIVGLDRFYLGYHSLGFVKLVTLGGLGWWWAFDVMLILTDNMTDADGDHLRR